MAKSTKTCRRKGVPKDAPVDPANLRMVRDFMAGMSPVELADHARTGTATVRQAAKELLAAAPTPNPKGRPC